MVSKKKKKNNNAVYCYRYRQKIRLKRLRYKNFDKKCRKSGAARQALYRAKKKQQLSTPSTSTITTTRANLRKIEGLQRRRENTGKLKLEITELQNSNEQLENENKRLKAQLASLTLSSRQTITDSRTTVSPSRIFFQNLSPNSKQRATARMMVQKPNLPRGAVESIRNKFGIHVSSCLF
jgi:predicted RNase H-like nuclease (RuvC/YqgF family)